MSGELEVAESWRQARDDHRARQAEAIAATALSLITAHGAPALTMAAIAAAAGISRQTLYRYYRDVDAVLVGVAELITHEHEQFEAAVAQAGNPAAQLDLILRTVAAAAGHGDNAAALRAALPPDAREVLTDHEARLHQVLADVLTAGVEADLFRSDLAPSTDAPLILGLVTAAANADRARRAIDLVHRIVDRQPQENLP